MRYDRAQTLRERLASDIAALTTAADAADAEDPQALSPGDRPGRSPARGAERDADASCARLEEEAAARAAAERPEYERKKAVYEAKRGRPPKPPDEMLSIESTIGLPKLVLADAGFADREAVAELQVYQIEPLAAIARTQPHAIIPKRPRSVGMTERTGHTSTYAENAMHYPLRTAALSWPHPKTYDEPQYTGQ